MAAGGATTCERSPPDITAAPRGPAGRGYAPPGRVACTARPQPQCGRNACARRGHQALVSVAIVSARPRLPPRGAPAPPPTGWCYITLFPAAAVRGGRLSDHQGDRGKSQRLEEAPAVAQCRGWQRRNRQRPRRQSRRWPQPSWLAAAVGLTDPKVKGPQCRGLRGHQLPPATGRKRVPKGTRPYPGVAKPATRSPTAAAQKAAHPPPPRPTKTPRVRATGKTASDWPPCDPASNAMRHSGTTTPAPAGEAPHSHGQCGPQLPPTTGRKRVLRGTRQYPGGAKPTARSPPASTENTARLWSSRPTKTPRIHATAKTASDWPHRDPAGNAKRNSGATTPAPAGEAPHSNGSAAPNFFLRQGGSASQGEPAHARAAGNGPHEARRRRQRTPPAFGHLG